MLVQLFQVLVVSERFAGVNKVQENAAEYALFTLTIPITKPGYLRYMAKVSVKVFRFTN